MMDGGYGTGVAPADGSTGVPSSTPTVCPTGSTCECYMYIRPLRSHQHEQ